MGGRKAFELAHMRFYSIMLLRLTDDKHGNAQSEGLNKYIKNAFHSFRIETQTQFTNVANPLACPSHTHPFYIFFAVDLIFADTHRPLWHRPQCAAQLKTVRYVFMVG